MILNSNTSKPNGYGTEPKKLENEINATTRDDIRRAVIHDFSYNPIIENFVADKLLQLQLENPELYNMLQMKYEYNKPWSYIADEVFKAQNSCVKNVEYWLDKVLIQYQEYRRGLN